MPEAMRVDGGLAFLEAQGKCRCCDSDDSCRQWLESSEQARGTPEFCPNASLFEGLKYADLDRERPKRFTFVSRVPNIDGSRSFFKGRSTKLQLSRLWCGR